MAVAGSRVQSYFHRTAGDAETNCVLEMPGKESWAIEIKRNAAPSVSKNFYIASEDVKPTQKFVVYAGKGSFPIKGGIRAISLHDVMREVMGMT